MPGWLEKWRPQAEPAPPGGSRAPRVQRMGVGGEEGCSRWPRMVFGSAVRTHSYEAWGYIRGRAGPEEKAMLMPVGRGESWGVALTEWSPWAALHVGAAAS